MKRLSDDGPSCALHKRTNAYSATSLFFVALVVCVWLFGVGIPNAAELGRVGVSPHLALGLRCSSGAYSSVCLFTAQHKRRPILQLHVQHSWIQW